MVIERTHTHVNGQVYEIGDGIPSSLLGTYIRPKEFLAYTFYEYTHPSSFEYDFFATKFEHEFLVFLAYVFNDSLMVEFESPSVQLGRVQEGVPQYR